MLTVVCGPFHPQLEQALADDLIAAKAADPAAPRLVVVPSESLRRRIVRHLARERGQVFLNLSVLTFHQLSRRLVEEATGQRRFTLADEHAFEELTRWVLERGAAGGPFAGVAATRGGCTALWQTLRDLKDAKVPPEAFVEAVSEGLFAEDSAPRLSALAALYRDALAASRSLGWIDYTDLDATAAEAAPASSYLQAQQTIAYYGFYDLTQAQYDVLRAVIARVEAVVYFPLRAGDPTWTFADRFLRRYLVGLSGRPLRVLDHASAAPPATAVVTCSGATDEVVACAKEILRLVEEEGVAFEDIGVVARSLDPYADIVSREFGRHHIPFVTTAQRALTRSPLVQAVLRLLQIAEEPTRDDVVDLLASPWLRLDSLAPGAQADPPLWAELARAIGVARGWEGWARLEALSGPVGSGAPESRTRGGQAATLHRLVNGLRDACAKLPDSASGSAHSQAWRAMLASLLGLDPADQDDRDEAEADEDAAAGALVAAFADPASLDPVRPTITRQAYVDAVRRRLEAGALPMTDRRARGVLVADATAARGIAVRVLFVWGLNEGTFPRVVREDAFLRDADRRVIETTLGCKIPEKLAAYDEERLLFSSLVGAGGERLVLSTQRADDAGRPLAPSWYLAAWQRQAEGAAILEVPRRTREKLQAPPFDRLERYTPREAAIIAALLGADPSELADEAAVSFFARAGRHRRAVEAWNAGLSPFDGEVGPPQEWLAEARARGYSASGLRTYAECPWRFFLTDVLEIEPPADGEEREGPTVRDWGLLAHEALAQAFRGGAEPVDSLWREVCARYAKRRAIGYPLAWELEAGRMGRVLADAVADDREDLARSGYAPLEVEAALSGTFGGREIPIRGRLDRIDGGSERRLRVIDWKLRWSRAPERRDLVSAALRGQALQAPLYAALARGYASPREPEEGPPVPVALYAVRARANGLPVERTWYTPDADAAKRVEATVATLVDGIEAGTFPMIPDAYCGRCAVAAACRRRHAPSRARAERDVRTARVAGLRNARLRAPEAVP